jgi:hypothetical protein
MVGLAALKLVMEGGGITTTSPPPPPPPPQAIRRIKKGIKFKIPSFFIIPL